MSTGQVDAARLGGADLRVGDLDDALVLDEDCVAGKQPALVGVENRGVREEHLRHARSLHQVAKPQKAVRYAIQAGSSGAVSRLRKIPLPSSPFLSVPSK